VIEGYLTADQAADHLGIARQTLYNLAGTPDFPEPTHLGRTPLWPVAELDAWRAKHPARRKPTGR
jgi:prophage regulatory protein